MIWRLGRQWRARGLLRSISATRASLRCIPMPGSPRCVTVIYRRTAGRRLVFCGALRRCGDPRDPLDSLRHVFCSVLALILEERAGRFVPPPKLIITRPRFALGTRPAGNCVSTRQHASSAFVRCRLFAERSLKDHGDITQICKACQRIGPPP